MTPAELRQALALLPADAVLTLPVHELRAALNGAGRSSPAHPPTDLLTSRSPTVAATAPETKKYEASEDAAHPNGNGDRLLTAREAAARLGVSTRYIYAHKNAFPFTRTLPGKAGAPGAVRFSEHGLAAWLARTR